ADVATVNPHGDGKVGAVRHQGGHLLGDFDGWDLKQGKSGCRRVDALTGGANGAGVGVIGGIHRWTAVLVDGDSQRDRALGAYGQGLSRGEEVRVAVAVITTVHNELAARDTVHDKCGRRWESGGEPIGYLNTRNIHVTDVGHLDRIRQSEGVVRILHQRTQVFRHENIWGLGKHQRRGVVFPGFRWIAVVVRVGIGAVVGQIRGGEGSG